MLPGNCVVTTQSAGVNSGKLPRLHFLEGMDRSDKTLHQLIEL
jgi:hypothetical protein